MPITTSTGFLEDTGQAIPKGQELTSEEMFRFAPGTPGPSADSVISSTSGIRADQALTSNKAQQEGGSIADLESSLINLIGSIGQQSEGDASSVDDLSALRQNLGMTSSGEEQLINEAGVTAGLEYDPLIREAEEAKRQGMPKALISAGERGGLMNTQFAGASALTPTEGGDFFGVGGELEKVKSAYDAQISSIRIQQQIAIDRAKSAQRKAIRTGKQTDFDNMAKEIGIASDLQKQAENTLINRANLVSGFIQQQETSDIKKYNLLKDIPVGETIEIGGKEYEGIAVEEIDPFYKSSDLISIAKTIQQGETMELTDPITNELHILEGLAQPDINTQIFKSTDAYGNETLTTIDKATGEIINQAGAGRIGKGFKGDSSDLSSDTGNKQFDKDIREWKLKLADTDDDTDWSTAWDSMASVYPELTELADPDKKKGVDIIVNGKTVPNQPLLDILLNKEKYYTKY